MLSPNQVLRASLIFFALAVVLLLLMTCSGCALVHRVLSPTATVTTPMGTVLTQTGDAQVPASVSTKTATQTMTLPAQSAVWVNAQTGALEYRLSKDTPITTVTKTEEAKAPQAFTPPAPPTLADESEAKMVLFYRIGLCVGIAGALFGLVRDYTFVMIGGSCVAGACLFGLFVQSHPALLVIIGCGIALKFVGPYIWHTQLKNLPAPTKIP